MTAMRWVFLLAPMVSADLTHSDWSHRLRRVVREKKKYLPTHHVQGLKKKKYKVTYEV